METLVYGNLNGEGLEIVRRDGRLFVRYDAGAHVVQWREDEISEDEFRRLTEKDQICMSVMLEIQERLTASGIDPYKSNWRPD